MADKSGSIQVEIFGQVYNVRAGSDPAHVQRLAAHVDAQMRDVARASGAVDSLKIAVLAALNIADAVFRARETGEGELAETRLRLEKAAEALSSAVDGR